MRILGKLILIGKELRNHSPFTMLGAATGIIFMLAGQRWFKEQAEAMFSVFHPLHVVLSAMVTAALFEIHRKAKNFLVILLIGVVGSIGVATLSDCILPFFGESILGVAVPTHAAVHEHSTAQNALPEQSAQQSEHIHTDQHHPRWHIGFIEEWYLVFPAALLGVLLAYFKPATHLPHASHVLISTWASSAHMLMNTQADLSLTVLLGMFIVLFIAVWLPCCFSDIIFPLLFVRSDGAHIGHSCILCGKKEQNAVV
ncbi:MAG TPA: hypothetical protein PK052_08105 [Anaerohalosphaeraceae bacterium]|nr:hypothetical protein [Phycisphaerae bacterium]HOK95355.1 hypothetical protein [Anaerohalosphaeraceae bacterium]HOL31932.1 hypothetical protein [Anaerohalosphaeraceae bacterium]HOM76443.1 hypothetical protein [Anaerohalosphaeraceae bacterium]HPC64285.1 hypothetical protein [Anaerohalosphaeraceae bacterium]